MDVDHLLFMLRLFTLIWIPAGSLRHLCIAIFRRFFFEESEPICMISDTKGIIEIRVLYQTMFIFVHNYFFAFYSCRFSLYTNSDAQIILIFMPELFELFLKIEIRTLPIHTWFDTFELKMKIFHISRYKKN